MIMFATYSFFLLIFLQSIPSHFMNIKQIFMHNLSSWNFFFLLIKLFLKKYKNNAMEIYNEKLIVSQHSRSSLKMSSCDNWICNRLAKKTGKCNFLHSVLYSISGISSTVSEDKIILHDLLRKQFVNFSN